MTQRRAWNHYCCLSQKDPLTLPQALTSSHPGPFTDQTGTGFELIITTLLVLCLLHFLGSLSGFLGHTYHLELEVFCFQGHQNQRVLRQGQNS